MFQNVSIDSGQQSDENDSGSSSQAEETFDSLKVKVKGLNLQLSEQEERL